MIEFFLINWFQLKTKKLHLRSIKFKLQLNIIHNLVNENVKLFLKLKNKTINMA